MKRILISSLLTFTLLNTVTFGDTVVSAGTERYFISTSDLDSEVLVERDGGLTLGFSGNSALSSNITNNGAIGDFSSDTFTFSGVIGGAGHFYKEGTGTTVFAQSNTYAGITNVNAGTLQMGTSNVLPGQSAVFVKAGATLDLNNSQQSVGSLSGDGSVFLGSAPLPADAGLVRAGAGSSMLAGGCLVLGGNSGFSGAITGSTLSVGGSTISSAGGIVINSSYSAVNVIMGSSSS